MNTIIIKNKKLERERSLSGLKATLNSLSVVLERASYQPSSSLLKKYLARLEKIKDNLQDDIALIPSTKFEKPPYFK